MNIDKWREVIGKFIEVLPKLTGIWFLYKLGELVVIRLFDLLKALMG